MNQNSPHANSIPEEWLSAYLDDELSAEQRQLVEAAVKEQPQLAQLLDELVATRRLIQQLPAFPTSTLLRSPSNARSELSDLDDGLHSLDDSSNSNNLASASDRQLQQRLADDRPTNDMARSDETGSSSRLSWRMLTLAASLIGVAALGATMWYQSDRLINLAFDTSPDNRVGSAMIPEGLVDGDSGPKAFAGGEGSAAPMSAPSMDALSMQRSITEGGMGGALGSGSSGQEFAGGFGSDGLGGGGLGGGGLAGGLGGAIVGSAGAAPIGNTPTNQTFDFTPQSSGELSQKEAFNQLHEDAKVLNAPTIQGEVPSKRSDGFVPPDLFAGPPMPGGGNQFGAANALENLKPSSSSAGAMSAEQTPVPQLSSPGSAIASSDISEPSLASPAPSDLAMELQAAPIQDDMTFAAPNTAGAMPMNAAQAALFPAVPSAAIPSAAAPASLSDAMLSDSTNAAPGAPSPASPSSPSPASPSRASSVPTDPAKPAPFTDPRPAASPQTMIEQLLNSGQSVEPLPSPAASNARGMQGMKAKQGAKGASESEPARKSEPMRGLDTANSALAAPSLTPPAAPNSEAQSADAAKGDAAKKSLPLKAQDKNQVLIPKSALYRSPAWSEAAVTAQLEGNPLYRPMLSLLSDSTQDKSLKLQADSKASQADDSVLTAVVRLTGNQRSAVIEQSKQLGIEPAIKDDGQTAWVLFLSATEFDRLLESANQQEKLNIFWISPAKQSATSDRRVLIVNPF